MMRDMLNTSTARDVIKKNYYHGRMRTFAVQAALIHDNPSLDYHSAFKLACFLIKTDPISNQ